jgi:NAD+ synthase
MEKCRLNTLVNSLSGGIDSTVAALIAKRAAPKGAIGLILPCSSESELQGERLQDILDARRVAAHLDMPTVEINLSALWHQTCELFEKAAREMCEKAGFAADERKIAWARNNLKPSLRMIAGGFFADATGGITVGTDNLDENVLGYFSIRGDGIADIQDIRDCTKAEVRQLAASGGFPDDLVNRVPTAGLWPGQTDEGELGFSYNDADKFICWALEKHLQTEGGLWERTLTIRTDRIEAIVADPSLPVSQETARKILAQNRKTEFKRKPHDLENTLIARGLMKAE